MPSIDPAKGALVVQEARRWVRTPYRHQGRLLGRAVDCVGLVIATGQELGLLDISADEWREFSAYARTPNPERMGRAMERFLVPLDIPAREAAPDGAIAWMGWREHLPMHLGIMGTSDGRRSIIHAYEHVQRCVEHGFVSEWPGRVVSWWSYPGALASGATHDDRRQPGNPR